MERICRVMSSWKEEDGAAEGVSGEEVAVAVADGVTVGEGIADDGLVPEPGSPLQPADTRSDNNPIDFHIFCLMAGILLSPHKRQTLPTAAGLRIGSVLLGVC
jgi:hypothetical protein